MPQPKIIGSYGYNGGLNTDASILTLPKGQLTALQDMIVDQGQLHAIPGYNNASITQPANGVGGSTYFTAFLGFTLSGHNYLLYPWINTGGSANTGIYYVEDFTGALSGDISNGAVTGFFDCAYCCEVMNNVAFIGVQSAVINTSAPSGSFASWSGSGSVSVITTQSGSTASGIIKKVNNFLFQLLSNGTLNWSSVGDGTTWPAGNSITFRYGDQDIATALGKIGNTLYIFKMNCIGALQTTSVVLSGAVTLGPLYPVFDNIGTFSMRSLDNLPTGEIVFLGTDYNVYKFDGSNLTNLSRRPYPESSIQNEIDYFLQSTSLSTAINSNLLWVRVNPLQHCVYLTIGGQTSFGSISGTICFAYDYINDYWYQPSTTFTDFVYMSSIGNISGWLPSAATQIFLAMTTDGTNVYSLSDRYFGFQNGNITSIATVSIPFTAESRDVVPLSLIVPLYSFAKSGYYPNITVTVGYDGGAGTTTTIPYTGLTGSFQRVIIPISFSDNTMTMQVTITVTSGALLESGGYVSGAYPTVSINPVYLDTEIAH